MLASADSPQGRGQLGSRRPAYPTNSQGICSIDLRQIDAEEIACNKCVRALFSDRRHSATKAKGTTTTCNSKVVGGHLGGEVRHALCGEQFVEVLVPIVLVGAIESKAKAAHASRPHRINPFALPRHSLHPVSLHFQTRWHLPVSVVPICSSELNCICQSRENVRVCM